MLTRSILAIITLLAVSTAALGGTLSPKDLQKKREGWFMTGLPLINYTSDAGLGYGLRAYLYNNGKKTQRYFDQSPYFVRLRSQFFQSTRGQAYHDLQVDFPFMGGSQWRLKGEMVYWAVLSANYYGLGAEAADAGLLDASGKSYTNANDYQSFLNSGTSDASLLKYNAYQRRRYYARWTASRALNHWLQFVIGFEYGHAGIQDWSGESFTEGDQAFVSGDTRFTRDRNQLVGSDGGWLNMLILGVALDWRDFESNPKEGILGEYFLELSGKSTGSDYRYTRNSASIRGYYTFFNRLTFAGRLAMSYIAGDAPFYEMTLMTFYRGRDTVLGGNRSLRGFPEERFIGRAMTLAQAEARFFVGETIWGGQRFGLMPVAYIDSGNIYDEFEDLFVAPRFSNYKVSYGAGVVIPWNLTTLLHIYYGASAEDASLFINFNHAY